MILNEDYFKDIEIKDEDINDVEEPKQELTLEEFHKLPEQYRQEIYFTIMNHNNDIVTQTSLIPRVTKRLDSIFDTYGIEHSEYVLTSSPCAEDCDTILDFGNYQLFCVENMKDIFINNIYD